MRIESLDMRVPLAVFLLFVVVAVHLVWRYYRRTNPDVGRKLRVGLGMLRTVSLLGAVVLAVDPFLRWAREHSVRPTIAAFLDVSQSMSFRDAERPRGQVMLDWWKTQRPRLAHMAQVREFAFGTRVARLEEGLPDTLGFSAQGTDLSKIFRFVADSLRGREVAALLVLTDGRHTLGPDPRRFVTGGLPPAYFLVFGDTSEQVDVAVTGVVAPEVAYVGKPFPIRVGLGKRGGEPYLGRVEVVAEGKAVAAVQARIGAEAEEWWTTVQVEPVRPGIERYQVAATPAPGERSLENNRTEFFVRVLPSRKKVLLVGGQPSPDFGFLRRALQSDSSVQLSAICYLGNGKWTPPQAVEELAGGYDEVILVYPTRRVGREGLWGRVAEAASKCTKVVLFAGPNTEVELAGRLLGDGRIKFVRKTGPIPVHSAPPSGQELHPLLALADFAAESRSRWSSLPPVLYTGWSRADTTSGTVVLRGRSEGGQTFPVGWLFRKSGRELAVFAVAGFWRWGFSPLAFGKSNEPFVRFVRNLTDWVYVSPEQELLRVEPLRQVFDGSEPVRFRAYLSDERFRPIDDARVSVRVRSRGSLATVVLSPFGDGLYEGSLPTLPAGHYRYKSEARWGDRTFGPVSGEFAVRPYTQELREPRSSLSLVQELAAGLGGEAALAAESDSLWRSLSALLNQRKWADMRIAEHHVWSAKRSWWLWAAILAALAVEWTIRRRTGLL